MNKYLKISLMVMVCSSQIKAQNEVKDQLTVPLTNPAKPGTLDINLVYGEINIQGYAGKEIIINAASAGKSADDSKEGMKRIPKGNPLGLSADENNNQIVVSTASSLFPINLSIKVPWQTALKLRTYDKGDIIVKNVVGDMEIDNVNGAINLSNVGGSIVANTYNGVLKATFQNANFSKPMAFSSMGGQIDITYPAILKANIKAKSENGDVFSDFEVAKSQAKVVNTSNAGVKTSTLDNWVYGKIGGGGPEIMLSNYYGNIYLRKAK